MVGITSFGGYLPRLRLARKAIVAAHVWSDPALKGRAKGERSMCNWDEDAVTMAVEAARNCLAGRTIEPEAVVFASSSAPFADRQNAGVIATALSLGEDVASIDIGSSQRAGVSALIQGLAAVRSGLYENVLVVASDKRRAKAASAGELSFGDGAAALMLGSVEPLLEFVAAQSSTVDFVDHFRAATEPFDYTWEERWIRDEGLAKIVPPVIEKVLAKAGLAADAVTHFVMPSTIGRAVAGIARQAGIAEAAVRDNLDAVCGETGVAHPLVMLLHTLETMVEAGDTILVVGFGQGCDAVLLSRNGRRVCSAYRWRDRGGFGKPSGRDELSEIPGVQRTDHAREGHARRTRRLQDRIDSDVSQARHAARTGRWALHSVRHVAVPSHGPLRESAMQGDAHAGAVQFPRRTRVRADLVRRLPDLLAPIRRRTTA